MSRWRHTLQLGDIFHDDARTVEEKATIIAQRIESLPLVPGERQTALGWADDIRRVSTAEDFDAVWDEFYDFADLARIWVDTWGAAS